MKRELFAGIVVVPILMPVSAWAQGAPVVPWGRAENAEPTAVTNGQNVQPAYDLTGRAITLPYAAKEKMIRGTLTMTVSTATSVVNFTGVASVKNYIAAIQCLRTDSGTTLGYAILNDTATTVIPLPPTGGAAVVYPVPLVTAANTALTIAENATLNSVICSVQGWQGS